MWTTSTIPTAKSRLNGYAMRNVTASQNCQNIRGFGKSGLKGAHLDKRKNRWKSSIEVDGKKHYLGSFASAEDAHAAYVNAAKKLAKEFCCTLHVAKGS